MELALIILFIVGYAGIAFEQKIKINKTAIALLLADQIKKIWLIQNQKAF
jgi:TM2 domain-containing membrane protein YozV